MKIPFSYVNKRKLSLQGGNCIPKISYHMVNNNLTVNNLLLYIESGCVDDMDTHCRRCITLYDKLLEDTNIAEQDKNKINYAIESNLIKVNDLESVYSSLDKTNNINTTLFFNTLRVLENCDRVIRNESRILKRFNLNSIINNNIMRGCDYTVNELCSLLDTYSISPKAKLNIALENISYSLFKSGHNVDLNKVTESIIEYFFTRDSVITDKEYNGYINVLENNKFIDPDMKEIKYIFEAKVNPANSFSEKVKRLSEQCVDDKVGKHINTCINIKNEKQASEYFDTTLDMIFSNKYCKDDSLSLFKSIYSLPLIGNVGKQFVDYKVEMSKRKIDIKKKFNDTQDRDIIKNILDDGDLIDYVEFLSESIHFENYILDDNYVEESNIIRLLESNDNTIDDIIKSFKASNEKSPSKFKNMMYRIMTKSPESIIDDLPDIFSVVRIMIYLCIAASIPLGPVFAAVLMVVNKLITMKLNEEQAVKMLKYFKSEKEKAQKKLDKLSGKEKEKQEEYIDCLNKCIEKTSKYLSDHIDDEHEELDDDDMDFGGDDIDFGDDDFSFDESAIDIESTILSEESILNDIIPLLSPSLELEIFENLSVLFANSSNKISNDYYNLISNYVGIQESAYMDDSLSSIINNRDSYRIDSNEEPGFIARYHASRILNEIIKEAKGEKPKKDNKNKKDSKNDIKDKVKTVKDNAKDKVKSTTDSAKNKVETTKDNIKNKVNTTKENIKENRNKKKEAKENKPKINLNSLKMAVVNFKKKFKDLKGKEQELWRNIDICANQVTKGIEKSLTSDRREAIIKGSIIPSFSKCIKYAISIGAVGAFTGPVGAIIAAVGALGASKVLNERERKLIYDEIDTELQVVEKQIQLAENEGNMNEYRFLLNYQKKLTREKARIKYGIHSHGKTIPEVKRRGN